MSSATKILVFKLKELVITGVIALLAVILLILFIIHITTKNKTEALQPAKEMFNPGIYTASIVLSGNSMDVEVCVDESQIKSVRLINTSEEIQTMYPLLSTSILDIESQLKENGTTSKVTYPQEAKYTSIVLLKAIELALSKARI